MPYSVVRNVEYMDTGSLGKEVLHNDFVLNAVLGISGAATIALAATDHTLTTANDGEAMRFVLILVGTLTANVNVLVPAESRVYVIDNRTTGAFTVTFRPAAGGGVAVDQSARTLIYCDGNNVYPVASGTGGGGGSGAPTDASYLVGASHTLLSGERVVTDTSTITWDLATAGQAKALIPADAVTYTHIQNVAPTRLLGRFAAGSGDVQEITPGTGLTLDSGGVLSATAVGQPLDATLTALAGLATGANQLPYSTGTDTFTQTPLTAFARTLFDDADAATMRGTISAQASDATLTALAGVTTGADTLPFFTGVDTASTTTLTAFMRGLLDDPDLATAQATLGITGGGGYTDEQAQDAVAAAVANSGRIQWTYNDTLNQLSCDIFGSSVGTAQLTNDGVTEAKLGFSDVTTKDASTTAHGLLRKLSGTATHYLDGSGAWTTPVGGASTFLALTDTPDAYTGQAGKAVVVNGAATGLDFTTAATGSYDLGLTWSGTLPASQVLMRYPFPRAVDFPAGLTGSQGRAAVAATALTTLDLRKNNVSVGSGQFAAAGTTATFTMASATSFAVGDVLTVHAPASADATLADLGLSLAGTRAVVAGEMGATTWLGLTDTPDAYTGAAAQFIKVNAAQTALEFVAQDPELAALAVLTSAADTLPYFTGSGTAALATFTAAGRTLVGAADAAAQRTALALGTMAQQDAANVAITGGTATLAGAGLGGTVGGDHRLLLRYNLASEFGQRFFPTAGSSGTAVQFLSSGAGLVGSIITTDSATAYNTSSDARLKHAITPLTGALDVVQALRPVSFLWNADGSPGRGFLAHELQREISDAVSGQPDAVNEDGSIRPQQVDHSRLVVWLTAALQETMAQVQALTARVTALEGATP